VHWYNPAPGGAYRFVVESRQGQPALVSQPFTYTGFSATAP